MLKYTDRKFRHCLFSYILIAAVTAAIKKGGTFYECSENEKKSTFAGGFGWRLVMYLLVGYV
ncbi:hypothetical protein [Cytobacillus sp. FSL R5-0596]|uniref:hypothetical protein n=1 Tax=Cytobacillus sp. FSL R5-0596 TaxID=2954696 RepID=UPI0030F81D52